MAAHLEAFFANRRVLVTGHTGFKGAWLAALLHRWQAEVVGYALPPEGNPNLCDSLGLERRIRSLRGDVRNLDHLRQVFAEHRPEVVFHLAAQPLVRKSYVCPAETYAVNVLGTVHVLEAARQAQQPCSVVVITTDKCYQNQEWLWGYREIDRLGGHDPYSSSKACAELVTQAYRDSFFRQGPVQVATARSGNVVGGGDWAEDRIVPDCVRALVRNEPIRLRNPQAVRPWQHVLEPLRGYLMIAHALATGDPPAASAWNLGPDASAHVTVREVAQACVKHFGRGTVVDAAEPPTAVRHETHLLALDSSKIRTHLGWRPALDFQQTMQLTIEWYRHYHQQPSAAWELTLGQIESYWRCVQQTAERRPDFLPRRCAA